MTPTSFMAHRIVQLALMNLTAAFKLQPNAKAENDKARLNDFYFGCIETKCARPGCLCPVGTTPWSLTTKEQAGQDHDAASGNLKDGMMAVDGGEVPSNGGDKGEGVAVDGSVDLGGEEDLSMAVDRSMGERGEEDRSETVDGSMDIGGDEDSGMHGGG